MGKLLLHLFLNIKHIEAFQVFKCSAVEEHRYSHHFACGERKLTVSFPLFAVFKAVFFDYFVKFFVKLIDNEINLLIQVISFLKAFVIRFA